MKALMTFCCVLMASLSVAQAAELQVHEITIKQGVISPARVEVQSGSKIKFVIKNEGPGPSEFENLDLRVEKVLAPGATSFVVMYSPKPGSYKFVDEFHPEAPGMMLIVK